MIEQNEAQNSNHGRFISPQLLLRGAIIVSLVLVAFSFSLWFSGTAEKAGEADRLFGSLRFAGFRADFVWVLLTTLASSVAFIPLAIAARRERVARITAALCIGQMAGFCLFIYQVLHSGTLDFG